MSQESNQANTLPLWMFRTYVNSLELGHLEGNRRYKDFLSLSSDLLQYSGVMRAVAFDVLKYEYPMRQSGYTTAVLSISVENRGRPNSAYYAYLHWPNFPRRGGVDPEYISISSTFQSTDGEYRARFIWYPAFVRAYGTITSELGKLEEIILSTLGRNFINIDASVFSGFAGMKERVIQTISDQNILIRILVAALLLDSKRIQDGTISTHTNTTYVDTIGAIWDLISKEIGLLLKDPKILTALVTFRNGGDETSILRLQCGQKIIPLTIREVLQTGDINYAAWREQYISQQCSDLVINGVSPNFPLYNNHSYISGTDKRIFENRAMHKKYYYSDIVQHRRQGPEQTVLADDTGEDSQNDGDAPREKYVNSGIEYAESFLLISPTVLLSTGEYVDITLSSLPLIIRRSHGISPTSMALFSNEDMFAALLFHLCYGAHVLHERAGIIHSDLHLNNMTYFWFNPTWVLETDSSELYTQRISDPVIAFIAGDRGEIDTYILPHIDGFGCLIDFSRSLIGPSHFQRLEKEFGKIYTHSFYKDQTERVIRTLKYYFPILFEDETNEIKVRVWLTRDFSQAFSILTAIDYYAISQNLRILLENEDNYDSNKEIVKESDKRRLDIHPNNIKLCTEIEQMAYNMCLERIREKLASARVHCETKDNLTIGQKIFSNVFSKWGFGRWNKEHLHGAHLIDIYNFNTSIKFSGKAYGDFPPWAQLDKILENSPVSEIDEIFQRGDLPFKESLADGCGDSI